MEREGKTVEASTAQNAQKGLKVTTSTVQQFTPLAQENRPTVDTAAAAFYLHKAQQTLRIWACKETGPIRPRRVGANLHWATADIRKLLGVTA